MPSARICPLAEVAHPVHGALKMQAPMPKLSDTPSAIRRRAPLYPGEHNAEVYGELLGLGEAELAKLAQAGAI